MIIREDGDVTSTRSDSKGYKADDRGRDPNARYVDADINWNFNNTYDVGCDESSNTSTRTGVGGRACNASMRNDGEADEITRRMKGNYDEATIPVCSGTMDVGWSLEGRGGQYY